MSNPNKVGLAEALRQRELDEEDRESSSDADDWAGPDSPTKKPSVPARKLVRPGERAPAPPLTRPAVTKPQPTGASSAEKRPQSDLEGSESGEAKGKRACDMYEINLAATEYGMCKCGFKKNEHVQSAAFRAAPRQLVSSYHPESVKPAEKKAAEKKPISLVDNSSPLHPVAAPSEEIEADNKLKACDAFEVDLQAKEFGTCKCGFKKAQHSKTAQTARRPSGISFPTVQLAEKQAQEERLKDEEEAKRKAEKEAKEREEFLERERKIKEMEAEQHGTSHEPEPAKDAEAPSEMSSDGPKACDSFEIDLNAAEFGTCKCGFKKKDHSKNALFSKPAPKPVHVSAPLGVPSVPSVSATKKANRPPPAFATAAKVEPRQPAVAEPSDNFEEEVESQEAVHAESAAVVVEASQDETREGTHQEEAAEEIAETQVTVLDPPQAYRALYDFDGVEVEDLSFKADEIIEVLEILDEEWMRGRINDRTGVFPSNYVSKLETETETETEQPAVAVQQEPEVPEVAAEEIEQDKMEEAPVEDTPVEETPAEEPPAASEPVPTEEEVQDIEPEDNEAGTTDVEKVDIAEDVPPEEPAVEEPVVEEVPAETIPIEEEAAVVAAEEENAVPFTVYALYDFAGEAEDDLSFQQGDVIEVVSIVDAEWWRGDLNGRIGIFPANFVSRDQQDVAQTEAMAIEPAIEEEQLDAAAPGALGTVVAQFDLEPQSDGDLGFKTGDVIDILEVIDDDWYRGSLNGTEGLVPRNYVSELAN